MSTIRVRKNKENPYIMLDKRALARDDLSWKAKGLYAYLLSLPDDWQLYMQQLYSISTDSRTATDSALKELIATGYIIRSEHRKRNEKGHLQEYEYTIYECPQTG